jgi:hypothetical protein
VINDLNKGDSVNRKLVKNGLVGAAIMNIGGVLLFSRALSNVAINEADPVVMSNFGLLMIMVWGLAYLGAASIEGCTKWLIGAFAIEKLVYVVTWIMWVTNNSLASLYAEDLFAGLFFSIYGLNDFVFFIFFGWVSVTQVRLNKSQ